MHLTPYLLMVLAVYAIFMGALGSVWVISAMQDAQLDRAKRLER